MCEDFLTWKKKIVSLSFCVVTKSLLSMDRFLMFFYSFFFDDDDDDDEGGFTRGIDSDVREIVITRTVQRVNF